MNPAIDFQCKDARITSLRHRSSPSAKNKPPTMVLFRNEIVTRKDFYDYIYDQISPVLPYLFNGYGYSLRQLILPWLWDDLSRGNCVMAGTCFQHMVAKGLVPFVARRMPCDSTGTRHYYYTGPEHFIFDFQTKQLIPKQGDLNAS
jgi:hypothetical protein